MSGDTNNADTNTSASFITEGIIDYATACERIRSTLHIVESDFRLLTRGEARMGYAVFQARFVGSILPHCPEQLTRCLYCAFKRCSASLPSTSTKTDGLTLEEFIRGLAVLRAGTAAERVKFVFCAYCTDAHTIPYAHLRRLVVLFPDEGKPLLSALEENAAFTTPEAFSAWALRMVSEHPTEPLSLFVWMYEFEDMLGQEGLRPHHVQLLTSSEGAMASYEEEKARSLASMTGLPQGKVDEILKIHKKLQEGSATGTLDRKTFSDALSSLPQSLCRELFRVLDPDHTECVSVKDLLSAVAVSSHGDQEEKVQFCFQLFDTTEVGGLGRAAFTELVDALWVVEAGQDAEHNKQRTAGLVESLFGKEEKSTPTPPPRVSLERFSHWAKQSALGEEFVATVWKCVLIDLNIRPATPAEELQVVGRLNVPTFHPLRSLGEVGTVWYLVDKVWYDAWEALLSGGPSAFSPTRPHYRDSITALVEEDTGLGAFSGGDPDDDMELASRQWSQQSPLVVAHAVPLLDNQGLLDENGKLKTGLDWGGDRSGPDCYEVLSEAAWRAVSSWYSSCSLHAEIARVVIEVDGRRELELHPPHVRLFRGVPDDTVTVDAMNKTAREAVFSSNSTLAEVKRHAAQLLKIDVSVATLWDCKTNTTHSDLEFARLTNMKTTLRSLDILDGTTYLVGDYRQVPLVRFSAVEGSVKVTMHATHGAVFTLLLTSLGAAEDKSIQTSAVEITNNVVDGAGQRMVKIAIHSASDPPTILHIKIPPLDPSSKIEETVGQLQGLLDISGVDTTHIFGEGSEGSSFQEGLEGLPSGVSIEFVVEENTKGVADPATLRPRQSMRAGTVIYSTGDKVKIIPMGDSQKGRPITLPIKSVKKRLERTLPSANGVTGLQNLANTCYLNSTVQALSHIRPIREYFLSDRYLYDLNKISSKGLGGKLAVSLGELLEKLWSTEKPFLPPRDFRHLIGSYNDDYANSHQQDANDFLLALLDGVGEEVNLVRNRRTVDSKLPLGASEAAIALLSWQQRTALEESFFISLLAYQQHNARVCSSCKKPSISIDTVHPPISLALPSQDETYVDVLLHKAGEKMLSLRVCVKTKATTNDLMRAVSGLIDRSVLPANLIALTLTADMHLFQLPAWRAKEQVAQRLRLLSPGTPIHIYEAKDYTQGKKILCQAVHRRLVQEKHLFGSPYKPYLLGTPLMVSIRDGATGKELYEQVWFSLKHLVPDYVMDDNRVYPFVLTRVKEDGRSCSDCGWSHGCIGCKIECSTAGPHNVHHRDTIGIDWDIDVYNGEYKKLVETAVEIDPSVVQANNILNSQKSCDVLNLLKSYFSTGEMVDGRVKCDHCGEMAGQRGTSRFYTLPGLLIIQLKRFTWTENGQQKVSTHVNFPLKDLDLQSLLTPGEADLSELPSIMSREKTKYDLAAVINHEGAQTTWGHYYSYIRLPDGSWCSMNDARCTPIRPEAVVTNKAYLLYYIRHDIEHSDIETLWPLTAASPKGLDVAKVKKAVQGSAVIKKPPMKKRKADPSKKADPCSCTMM